jgi:hypothetical protein
MMLNVIKYLTSYPKRMIHLDSRLGGKSFKQRLLKVSYPKRMIHLDSRLGGKSFKQRLLKVLLVQKE